jgi:ketosteroid isomerase-like protein
MAVRPIAAMAAYLIAATPPADPAPVVAAERAFAADGLAMGVKASFLRHSAPEAVVFRPDPVNAHAFLRSRPDPQPGAPRRMLQWWPTWAGIAASGDLGFTTGPVAVDGARGGHYFTVWKRRADGAWKWVYDGGAEADSTAEPAASAEPVALRTAAVRPISAALALSQVAAAEAALARRARTDQKAALLAVLAPDARVYTAPLPPAKTPADVARVLSARPSAFVFTAIGGGASQAGDLAWTYGSTAAPAAEAAVTGYYVRVWQRRPRGWRLVFEQILPRAAG